MHNDANLDDGVLILDIHLGGGDGLDDLRSVPGEVKLLTLRDQLIAIIVLDVLQHIHEFLYTVQLAAQVSR